VTTTPDLDWAPRARQLAETLIAAGKLADPAWAAAVRAVPRHVFVPTYHQQDNTGAWHEADTSTDAGRGEWLDTVYSNSVLTTALGHDDTGGTIVLSTSSQPGLMTRMLEALDVHDGHRVLEIGTGTGYNAALLCHRLGAQNVFSVDVEPELVATAGNRLASLGYRPQLAAVDGSLGWAEHAPFDAIIATCAVPAIPWAWVEHTRVGGVILTDVKPAFGAGSLVRLTRTTTDNAEGRFDPIYAAFMDLRHQPGRLTPTGQWSGKDRDTSETHTTTLDPRTPWTSLVVWFLASFALGPRISIGYTGPDTTQPPIATTIATPDGSWAEITLGAVDGGHQVVEGGPRQLWSIVEDAHQRWTDLGQPGWERFGLTVTRNQQTVWFDHPNTGLTWTLPTPP
jgi:methyltransferase of ATP-grasp peptide maturase system